MKNKKGTFVPPIPMISVYHRISTETIEGAKVFYDRTKGNTASQKADRAVLPYGKGFSMESWEIRKTDKKTGRN